MKAYHVLFLAMAAFGIFAVLLARGDHWILAALTLLLALGAGVWSLDYYVTESKAAARRVLRGKASGGDLDLLRRLNNAALWDALKWAQTSDIVLYDDGELQEAFNWIRQEKWNA